MVATRSHPLAAGLVTAAALVVVIAGLQAAKALLVPFLLAAFIAIVCLPPLAFLRRHGWPDSLAILGIALALVLAIVLIGAFVGASVADFTRNLPDYQARLQAMSTGLAGWLAAHGIRLDAAGLAENLDLSVVMGLAGNLLSGFGNALANAFLIVLTVIFLLIEATAIPHKWRAMGAQAPSTAHIDRFIESVHSYLVIKGWVSLATGLLVAGWLALLGVDYPALWGLLAFLFNFVPNIGSIIAAAPAVLLALIQLGTGMALATGLGYLVINLVMGNIVEPRFMGRGVGLSTLVVFLSLVFWGWVLGPVGMLLSVPLTMIVKLALEANESTRWIAILIGPDIPESRAE